MKSKVASRGGGCSAGAVMAAIAAVAVGGGVIAAMTGQDDGASPISAPRTATTPPRADDPGRGCAVSRVVVDPYLTETVTLRCAEHEWTAERTAGRAEFTVTSGEADGWTLTSASTGPLVVGDGPVGVVVVLDLTRGGTSCDVSANYAAGSGESSPAVTYQDHCARFDPSRSSSRGPSQMASRATHPCARDLGWSQQLQVIETNPKRADR